MDKMHFKKSKENESGLNTEFINEKTKRKIPLEQALKQIKKGNPKYSGYEIVDNPNGTTYIRSKPDNSKNNNIE